MIRKPTLADIVGDAVLGTALSFSVAYLLFFVVSLFT